MSRVVTVTGASGHIGAALVRALIARGDRVRVVVRSDTRAIDGLDVDKRRGDITDPSALREAIDGSELVFHAAARVSLESGPDPVADRTNVEGTRNVLEVCRALGVRRVVHFSSVHAVKRDRRAASAYEQSKERAEREVDRALEGGLDVVVVRPAAVVGPFDHKPSYIGRVLILLARGLLPMTVRGGQSWVDVREIASSSIAAAERGERGARYALEGHWMTMKDFMSAASKQAGARAPIGTLPPGLAKAFAPLATVTMRAIGQEPLFTATSIDALDDAPRPTDPRAANELGHAPRPIEETLRDAYTFFRERGMLRR
jgi:dihydroflavonol-4-reductase